MLRLMIGVTTYNRPEHIESLARSLASHGDLAECFLRIHDDASTAFDVDSLRKTFPSAASVTRRAQNLGADENIRQMFVDFLESDEDVLIAVDSDLILHPDWADCIRRVLPQTDGVLSLYNSTMHSGVASNSIAGYDLVEKQDLGSAGVAFSREVMSDIIRNVPASRRYDWDWSRYLRSRDVRLLCLKNSLCQHVGIEGTNASVYGCIDFGRGFRPGTEVNAEILFQYFDELMPMLSAEIPMMAHKAESIEYAVYRLGRAMATPFRWVARRAT